ncbi:hypothetical protein G9G63_24245 [Paenibacillus sp. EKM202P]|uniref:DUF6386 family protein n=1 Tax=unclassified Paenibacillus TaxID=185978 RepID=UPI0013EA0CBF|nr:MULTISPECIES: DUF6386 family protein [unclassified Paenibacillus]KAF6559400.1 hypothetical protein G9G63_24245 [Paenibacillus sp. EKM202P]KAF6564277.1 hypothetical protein G9G64_23655 [Paenibacillus sp. EKM207P]MCV9950813.1 DUF6386 family protein [Paenibacillus sp. BT-177]
MMNMAISPFQFTTDTATLCLFDTQALKHRLNDEPDWWSIEADELGELNAGNAAFLNLGADGTYEVVITDHIEQPTVRLFLKVPSGNIFIGAGEEATGGELEPDCVWGGLFLSVQPGLYECLASRGENNRIYLSLKKGSEGSNSFTSLVRL